MDIEGPEDCDLLVIGASLTGSAVARDASGRGLKVCLIERGDLAATAAPAALTLAGALREPQAERKRLLALAPHAVRPLRLVIPQASQDWRERAAVLLSDPLGTRAVLPPPARVDLGRAPHADLLQQHLAHGREESDCSLDEARLVVLHCLDARERGASIRLHTEALALKRRPTYWEALVRAARGEHRIYARAVVNAAGPWAGEVLSMAFPGRAPCAPPVMHQQHIIVPRLYSGGHAYSFESADEGRLVLMPFARDFTLVSLFGPPTTAAPSGLPTPTRADETALRKAVNAVLQVELAPQSALARFARLRAAPGTAGESGSDRTELAFLTLSGGPLVTCRLRAERALDRLGAPGPRWTGTAPLPGGDIDWLRFGAFIAAQQRRWPWLDPSTTHRLAHTYGTRMARIVTHAQTPADLGTPMGGGLTIAELTYLATHEFARSAEDVLWRRSSLGLQVGADERARIAAWFARQNLAD